MRDPRFVSRRILGIEPHQFLQEMYGFGLRLLGIQRRMRCLSDRGTRRQASGDECKNTAA